MYIYPHSYPMIYLLASCTHAGITQAQSSPNTKIFPPTSEPALENVFCRGCEGLSLSFCVVIIQHTIRDSL